MLCSVLESVASTATKLAAAFGAAKTASRSSIFGAPVSESDHGLGQGSCGAEPSEIHERDLELALFTTPITLSSASDFAGDGAPEALASLTEILESMVLAALPTVWSSAVVASSSGALVLASPLATVLTIVSSSASEALVLTSRLTAVLATV